MFGSKTTVESIFKNDSFRNSKQASFDDEAESVKGLSDWTELSPNSGLVNPCLKLYVGYNWLVLIIWLEWFELVIISYEAYF